MGLFGGTFDPPHLGHLIVASEVRWRCAFDELLVVVANDPWQKAEERSVSSADVRLDMVRRAFDGHVGITASSMEIDRGGPTYTIDTVLELIGRDPGIDLSIVLGADAVAGLDSWHRAEELARLVDVVAVARRGYGQIDLASMDPRWRIVPVDVPLVEISSTDLRSRCGAGLPIDFLVADGTRSVIEDRGLYGWGR